MPVPSERLLISICDGSDCFTDCVKWLVKSDVCTQKDFCKVECFPSIIATLSNFTLYSDIMCMNIINSSQLITDGRCRPVFNKQYIKAMRPLDAYDVVLLILVFPIIIICLVCFICCLKINKRLCVSKAKLAVAPN